jgi:hypothetical protein
MDRPDERWQYVAVQRGEHHLRMDSSRTAKGFQRACRIRASAHAPRLDAPGVPAECPLSLDGVCEDLTSMQTGRHERRECSGWDALRLAKP